MRKNRLKTALLVSVASSLLWAAPALAQTAAPAPEQAAGTDKVVLPAIDVQGNTPYQQGYQPLTTSIGGGVETPILDLPQSVSVVTGQVLQDQGARSLDDALANVGGITQANNLGGTQDAFTRRGFGDNRDGSILIDGLRTVLPRSLNGTTDRVEVLKGPASALYGIVDPGGLVNVVTRRPEMKQQGTVGVWGTSFGGGGAKMDVTGPIGNTRLAYRVIGEYQDTDYWRSFGTIRQNMIAPSLGWYGDDTTIEASYWHVDYSVPFDRGTIFDPATGNPVNLARGTRLDEPYNLSKGSSDYGSLRVKHNLTADWSLSAAYTYSVNNYKDNNARAISYNARTGILTRRSDATQDSTMFNHAARTDLAGKATLFGMRHDLLFGAAYDYASTRRTDMVRGRNNATFNVFQPVYGTLPTSGIVGAADDSDQTERLDTYSFYAQDAVHLNDQWIVVGGLRYQHYDQMAGKGRPFNKNTDVSDGQVIPRAGLVYKLRPDVSLFASYSRSFKPNSSIANPYGALPPEKGRSWEAGAKLDLAEGVTVTGSVFDIVKENVLYRYEINGSPVNGTAGEVRSRGFELDFAGRITPELSVIGSYALIDAKVTKDPDVQGKRLAQVARNTAALSFTYDFGNALMSDGLRAGFGGRYMGRRAGMRDNSFFLPAYTVFDAFVAYDVPTKSLPVKVQLNLKNVFDKTYYTSSIGSNTLGVAVGEPFQAILATSVKF